MAGQCELSEGESSVHHRDTEHTEDAQSFKFFSLCVLCALCVSVVSSALHMFNCNPLYIEIRKMTRSVFNSETGMTTFLVPVTQTALPAVQ